MNGAFCKVKNKYFVVYEFESIDQPEIGSQSITKKIKKSKTTTTTQIPRDHKTKKKVYRKKKNDSDHVYNNLPIWA